MPGWSRTPAMHAAQMASTSLTRSWATWSSISSLHPVSCPTWSTRGTTPPLPDSCGELASFSRLIVFDKRGTGLSDRDPNDRAPILEDRVNDMLAVMEAAGSEKAAIMGISETAAMSLLFAAAHPEMTTAVIAYGAWTNGSDTRPAYPWAPSADDDEWLAELERNWGRGAMFLEDIVPSLVGDKRYEGWYAKLERLAGESRCCGRTGPYGDADRRP